MPKKTSGRPDTGPLIKQVLLVALALHRAPGNMLVDKHVVRDRFGLEDHEVDHIFAILSDLSDLGMLPTAFTVDETDGSLVALNESDYGQLLRLTQQETAALSHALQLVDLEDNERSTDFCDAVGPASIGEARSDEPALSIPGLDTLFILADALSQERSVAFDYVHIGSDGVPSRRHVKPLDIHPDSSRLYLRAYDYDRQGERNFAVSNISNASPAKTRDMNPLDETDGSVVRLTFTDRSFFNLFEWNNSKRISKEGELPIVIELPWYGTTDWIARRMRACRGTCTSDNETLNELVQELERTPLPELPADLK